MSHVMSHVTHTDVDLSVTLSSSVPVCSMACCPLVFALTSHRSHLVFFIMLLLINMVLSPPLFPVTLISTRVTPSVCSPVLLNHLTCLSFSLLPTDSPTSDSAKSKVSVCLQCLMVWDERR